jgi:hypothetical protein
MASDPTKVFISYSHDSPEHAQHVLELANRLWADGIDCTVDQYVVVPEERWTLWMERQIRESNFATQTVGRFAAGKKPVWSMVFAYLQRIGPGLVS